ncbi:toll/interleukin-1 receptor domain-containing protein [Polymorphobacter arshaanensis]|uniref:toll/interleukin-1 receptor domain-containing protein n=1 Tax=Glacieibacterium arshaanense TaxID=2511025 RepID=UPI00140947A3|nr:toll/interleukin-1 receptor domain-containing protein [Polymorphobacter arshaanensis]
MSEYRYKAFISYSWADAKWAKWLLGAIETYRTPAALVGQEGRYGPVPARLRPLFKDREEQPASAGIGSALDEALASSEFLIVICSPRAAASKWVNHEIAWFKTHRDPSRILALIVDGEPGTALHPAPHGQDCFPKALTHIVNADLTVTHARADAPLAADARKVGDGKTNAKLKLVAAMLGVGLDELVNRDVRRRALRARLIASASLALAAVMAVLAWFAVQARNEAQQQRAAADGLVEFMLTDLREKLEPVGRLDALDVVGKRALTYYGEQPTGDLDADALGRRARALHLVGEVRDLRGDSEGALNAFKQAAATTQELLARDPRDGQRIFDHAQSVYWVGYVAYQRGESTIAEPAFRDYKRLAQQLVALDPGNDDWQMELSYAEGNLGTFLLGQKRYAEAERAFAAEVAIVDALAAKTPRDMDRQLAVAESMAPLALTRRMRDDPAGARAALERETAIYRKVLGADPKNATAKRGLLVAMASSGAVLLAQGDIAAALAANRAADDAVGELLVIDPSNSQWTEFRVRIRTALAEILLYVDDLAASRSATVSARYYLNTLTAKDRHNHVWNAMLPGRLGYIEAQQLRHERKYAEAAERLSASIRHAGEQAYAADSDADFTMGLMLLLQGELAQKRGNDADARAAWQQARQLTGDSGDVESRMLAVRYIALDRLDQPVAAGAIAAALDKRGYRHPLYTQARTPG